MQLQDVSKTVCFALHVCLSQFESERAIRKGDVSYILPPQTDKVAPQLSEDKITQK